MSRFNITTQGTTFEVEFKSRTGTTITFVVNGKEYQTDVAPIAAGSESTKKSRAPSAAANRNQKISEICSPIPGIISDIKVTPGQTVSIGDVLVVIEAMKMENPIKSPRNGLIDKISVQRGQEVKSGEVLVSFAS